MQFQPHRQKTHDETKRARIETQAAVVKVVTEGCCQQHVKETLEGMTQDALACSMGVLMGLPMVEMAIGAADANSDHILVYCEVNKGQGKLIMEGFAKTIQPFLVPAPFVTMANRHGGAEA